MKKLRCAIYTRKSTEEGLHQDFNSLDAQREACEAYIASQKSEGWMLVPTRYDDGGWSGGNMERPGLKAALADIEARKIDILVVYKVDRLSRSLADFARIVDLFDRRGVSFVSVTQAFNTTTSMGRLTLNVLLSFAQFEREVTGERIRDKIAASKAKGMWMGGCAPLGYDPDGRTLKINDAEAETVRHIFRRYLDLGSVYKLARELERDGVHTKIAVSKAGRPRGGRPYTPGNLATFLASRIFIGEISHKGHVYPGLHPAILDRELFDAVQARLHSRKVVRRARMASRTPLAGILYDALGNRMTVTHARGRGGKRYVYYISPVTASHPEAARVLRRVPATSIEDILITRIRQWSGRHGAGWSDLMPFLKKVEVHRGALIVQLSPPAHEQWEAAIQPPEQCSTIADGTLRIIHPLKILTRGGRTSRLDSNVRQIRARPNRSLIAALRRSHVELNTRGIDLTDLKSGLQEGRGVTDPYLRKLSGLAFLAPDIQRAILDGRQPSSLTLSTLLSTDIPLDWNRQRQLWSFEVNA